jgi:queuine tRNA-ribosyltransferase
VRRGSFEVVTSFAGHLAMLDHDTREIMHAVVGPRRESAQLYVQPSRLATRLTEGPEEAPLVLLDVGLGAGSNACAAIAAALAVARPRRPLVVHSFDRTLDAFRLAAQAEHAAAFGIDAAVRDGVAAALDCGRAELPGVTWQLHVGELPGTLAELPPHGADVVFWDPFSPRQNPGLWSVAAFTALRRACAPGASVHTYSGATATRSALLLSGFWVGLGEPLGGKKRATTAALPPSAPHEPLDGRFLARLGRSSAPLPADAPADAFSRLAAHPQLADPAPGPAKA